jgi:UDP-N-acetylglucosamine acyltransferase
MIHPTAIVDSKAEIDSNVKIGPYSIIEADVVIGSGTVVGPHVVIQPYVTIGSDCKIFQFASIGAFPQALKFKGEKTYVKIGRGTIIREFVTINRGTDFGGGVTEIGEKNFLMAYAHIAHDCKTGREVILANQGKTSWLKPCGTETPRVFRGNTCFIKKGLQNYIPNRSYSK